MYVGRIRLVFFSPAGVKNWFTREDTTKTTLYARYYPPPPPPRSVRSKYPDTVPMFLGGVSFGGLVAAHASVRIERLHGTVLVAPCIDVEWTPLLRFQARIGSFLARVCPHVRGAAAVAPDRLSSDPDAIKEYRNDPLVEVANVRFLAAFEILKGFRKVRAFPITAIRFPDCPHDTDLCFFHLS